MNELNYRKKTDTLNIIDQNENFIEKSEENNSKEKKTLNLILNNQNRLLSYLILFRIINAIFTKTYFNPDEYWQSVEVAHYIVFGYPKLLLFNFLAFIKTLSYYFLIIFFTYGYLTWEWKEKIRSIAHPLLFATLYKSLAILGLDEGNLFIYTPRIFQAVFAGIGDLYTYKLAKKLFNESTANWTLFCSIVSWFNFFCSIRMLSNSIETVLTTVALYYWPWPSFLTFMNWNDQIKALRISLTLAAICCILRPTNVIIWGFLGIQLLLKTREHFTSIILNTLFITIISISTIVLIDYTFYGELVFVPINFLYVNVIQSISLFYGSHPWHWYLSQGIPFITTTLLPFILKGIYDIYTDKKFPHHQSIKTLIWLIILMIFGYSLLSHKEFRFIYPLLPIMIMCAGYCLREITIKYQKKISKIIVIFLIITNVPLAFYANFVHQRGVVDVMNYLRNEARSGKVHEIGFLMPCNSTPFYSNLHFNLSMWYLTCDPPLISKEIDIENYIDEADQFYTNPHEFLKTYFEPINSTSSSTDLKLRKWPNYLIMFEVLVTDINHFLKKLDYREASY
ncbi:GPI mannosyltransferase 3 [Rhizophagus clarus]|uniref:Mannosyltransferase n=1 Tax=Rhizophagus clarus TaxID=94130 RepID=A0A8H3MB84_9GLOM|nr:GPI mannosyltransferase 3 [Rhizophagus clarus]